MPKWGWLWSLMLTFAGAGGVYGLTAIVFISQANAYTATSNVTIGRAVGETYEGFIRRAETVARAAVQRSFDQDILVTDVSVTILGENRGSIAPVVLVNVSRQSWRSRPDPQQWATYFPTTRVLLGFETQAPAATAAPQIPPQAVPVLPNGQPIIPSNAPGNLVQPKTIQPGTNIQPGTTTAPTNLAPGTINPGIKTPPSTTTTTPGGTPNTISVPNRR